MLFGFTDRGEFIKIIKKKFQNYFWGIHPHGVSSRQHLAQIKIYNTQIQKV
jgi:hypothetical protein